MVYFMGKTSQNLNPTKYYQNLSQKRENCHFFNSEDHGNRNQNRTFQNALNGFALITNHKNDHSTQFNQCVENFSGGRMPHVSGKPSEGKFKYQNLFHSKSMLSVF